MNGNKNITELFLPSGCLSEQGLSCFLQEKLDQPSRKRVQEHLTHCELCSYAVKGFGSEPENFDFEETRQRLHNKIELLLDNQSTMQPHHANQNQSNAYKQVLVHLGKWRNIAALLPLMILLGSYLWLTAALQMVNQNISGISDYHGDSEVLQTVPTEIEEISKFRLDQRPPAPQIADFSIQETDIPIQDEIIIDLSEEVKIDHQAQLPPIIETETIENEIFIVVEDPPRFRGGQEKFEKFLTENLRYPSSARQSGISGTVYVTFVIDTDGKVKDARVLRGVHSSVDEEALRVIRIMPEWIPGKQRGKAVKVQFTMPVRFTLE